MTKEQKLQAYAMRLDGCTYQEIANKFGVTRQCIQQNIGAIGSRDDFTTFFRDKDNEITVKCGCFLGKIDKFLEKVTQTHGDSKYALVYRAAVEVARLQIDLSGEAPKDADE